MSAAAAEGGVGGARTFQQEDAGIRQGEVGRLGDADACAFSPSRKLGPSRWPSVRSTGLLPGETEVITARPASSKEQSHSPWGMWLRRAGFFMAIGAPQTGGNLRLRTRLP